MPPGENVQRYLRLIDARYPAQLDAGLNSALQLLRKESRESKRSRRKRRNSLSKQDGEENGEGQGNAEEETATNKIEDQIFDFISLTFRVECPIATYPIAIYLMHFKFSRSLIFFTSGNFSSDAR